MFRAPTFFGLLVLNVVAALIGTAILDAAIGKVFPVHSLTVVLWKEWVLSIACAAFIGFWMWHMWQSDATKRTWVLPAVWFGIRSLSESGAARCGFSFLVLGATAGFVHLNAGTSSCSQSRLFAVFPNCWVPTFPHSFTMPTALPSQLCRPRRARNLLQNRDFSAGLNRHVVEDERALRERNSDPLGPEFWVGHLVARAYSRYPSVGIDGRPRQIRTHF